MNILRALKMYNRKVQNDLDFLSIEEFLHELINLKQLNHDNIVRLYGIAYYFSPNDSDVSFGIIQELMHCDLNKVLKEN
jgi:hypothetical protein